MSPAHLQYTSKYNIRCNITTSLDRVKGVCQEQVAGKWMKGARLRGSGGSLTQKLVGLGYQQVCGDPEVWGDGITPVPAAHLEGKLALT